MIHKLLAVSVILLGAECGYAPCETMECATGLVCDAVLIPKQSCNIAPCPRMPECVPKNSTCDAKKCAAGETCILRRVTCVKEPCFPITECVKFPNCGTNEEFNECSRIGECEPSCTDYYPTCPDSSCGAGACECAQGFVRHAGKCIASESCPDPECPKNQKYFKCPSPDQKTCRNIQDWKKSAGCMIASCQCVDGYVRDDDWNCVPEKECPSKFDCEDPNEELKKCSTVCEPTCDNRNPVCIKKCGPPKCQCKPGHARQDSRCIRMEQCPLNRF